MEEQKSKENPKDIFPTPKHLNNNKTLIEAGREKTLIEKFTLLYESMVLSAASIQLSKITLHLLRSVCSSR